jgi:tetratricopeptide (TPR) repeat protein
MGIFSNIFSKQPQPEQASSDYKLSSLDRLEKAAELEQSGKWNDLLVFSRKWAEIEPLNFFAWQCIGDSLVALGKITESIPIYQKGLEVAPANPSNLLGVEISSAALWYRLGNSYVKLDDINNAINAFKEGTRNDPKGAQIWNNLGIEYVKINNPMEADKAFRQAINLEPKNLEFINNLGILFAMYGMKKEVANIHGRLSELDPNAASVFLQNAKGYVGAT